MLKIKLPIPPYDEQLIKTLCAGIIDVKFDPAPTPVSCIAIVNTDTDVENAANEIRNKSIFGKNLEVEIINDDESLYQEHIEADDEDDCMALFNEFEKNNTEPKQEGIDDETFVKLLQMRLREPRPVVSKDDVIEILSDTTEEDLDNEEVLSKIDDEANNFIHGLLEIQNLYTTKSGDTEETPSASIVSMSDNTVNKSKADTETDFDRFISATDQSKDKKRPSELGGLSMHSYLDIINKPATTKKVKRDRLDSLLINEDVPSKENNSTIALNSNEMKPSSYDSDLNCNPTNTPRRLSLTDYNGSSEDGTSS